MKSGFPHRAVSFIERQAASEPDPWIPYPRLPPTDLHMWRLVVSSSSDYRHPGRLKLSVGDPQVSSEGEHDGLKSRLDSVSMLWAQLPHKSHH